MPSKSASQIEPTLWENRSSVNKAGQSMLQVLEGQPTVFVAGALMSDLITVYAPDYCTVQTVPT